MKAVKNALSALCYIVGFFGSLGFAFLWCWLAVQAQFGLLPLAELDPALGIDSNTFCAILFSVLSLSSMAMAGGVLAMLNRRSNI